MVEGICFVNNFCGTMCSADIPNRWNWKTSTITFRLILQELDKLSMECTSQFF